MVQPVFDMSDASTACSSSAVTSGFYFYVGEDDGGRQIKHRRECFALTSGRAEHWPEGPNPAPRSGFF